MKSKGGSVRSRPLRVSGFFTADECDGDIFIHFSVLGEIGITALPTGITLTCRAIERPDGWHAISVSVIDFSTAHVSAFTGEDGEGFDPFVNLEDVGEFEPVRVKSFSWLHGGVAVSRDKGSPDIFIHGRVLKRGGLDAVFPGQGLLARIGNGPRGPLVAEVKIA